MIIINPYVDKSYPEIKVEKENHYYAKILLEDYAGLYSELGAITQYSFQKFAKYKEDDELTEMLSKIAVVEMHHLEILGKLIKLLGLKPEYKYYIKNKDNYKYWNSNLINYTTNNIDMLLDDIRIEKIAITNYEYRISIINDKYIKKIIYRIIEDELKHLECFKYLLQKEYNKLNKDFNI